jgi:DNA uptake protein ComE-like DNA-binding protein
VIIISLLFCILLAVALLFVKILINTEPVREWFGHSRRERRASLILLAIIIIVLFARYLVPGQNMQIEDLGILLPDSGEMTDTAIARAVPHFSGTRRPVVKRDTSVHKRALVDINICDTSVLIALPGIGPVLAARIVKYRNLLGGFARIEQLREVYGLSPETFDIVSKRVYADSTAVRKIPVNSSGYRELSRLIYLEKYDISAILKYRQLAGRINNIDDLLKNNILTADKAKKVRPYLDFK